jgi:lipopolysaccharide/colanic/teichoic acid biosynthesis glycosyltransferase
MISQATNATPVLDHPPTIWGLEPVQLHDRYWAARGVQVVRQGDRSEIVDKAELFLLTDAQTLVMFRLRDLVDTLSWLKPRALCVRLRDQRKQGYRERVVTDQEGRFVRFERSYGQTVCRVARVVLTPDHELARAWQTAADLAAARRLLRKSLPRDQRPGRTLAASTHRRDDDDDIMQLVRLLVRKWRQPDATIEHARRARPNVWAPAGAAIAPGARFVGPIWIGAGRSVDDRAPLVGPGVLWDDPDARPKAPSVRWDELEPTGMLAREVRPAKVSRVGRWSKRTFDIVFSLCALTLTLPLFPLIALAIVVEDGWPVMFAHRRETLGARPFMCLKFRSMRRDAEAVKAQLAKENKSDGPQFHMDDDPRLTRVGRFLRRSNLDELPQFINVLMGDMSVVGPRPSPFDENQFCPAWREARLSTRPGITGLWQVKRSRLPGLDFQEWIKYDLEYVERMNLLLDLKIVAQTIPILTRGLIKL